MFDLNHHHEPDMDALSDLLARHVDSLNAGVDMTPDLMREYDEHPSVTGLLQLSRELHTTMTPARPSLDFVEKLGYELEQAHMRRTRSMRRWSRRQRSWTVRLSRVVGAAVSLLAVLGLVIRVLVSFAMLIMLIARQKQRSAAAA
jgi:hypothetical protein